MPKNIEVEGEVEGEEEDEYKISFQRPKGKKFRVLHCSCTNGEEIKGAYANEVYMKVDDDGTIELECTNCNTTYELTDVISTMWALEEAGKE